MGAYYDIVNPSKRQYVRISGFGENFKWGGLVTGSEGRSIHAMAVAWLICRFQGCESAPDDWVGYWSGDPIYFASDESSPDLDEMPTSTPKFPERNLAKLALDEYEDITPCVIQQLCEKDNEIAVILVGRIRFQPTDEHPCSCSLMLTLGRVALRLKCSGVEEALQSRFGEDWQKLYDQAEIYWSKVMADWNS